jgi:hypothetical protein
MALAGGAVDAPQTNEAGAATRPPEPGVFDELSNALVSARAAVSNFLDLLSFEARRAGLALVWMVACGLIAAVCIVAAWLGLMAALVMWAVSMGCSAVLSVIAVALINGVAGFALICVCKGMSQDLMFPATRRQLAGKSPVKPVAP